jgi:hypothetical protein
MLETAQGMGLGWHDAGLISLGFFRILELEINERLVVPSLRGDGSSDIQQKLGQLIEDLREKSGPVEKQSNTTGDALATWERLWIAVENLHTGKTAGIELGALERLLGRARHVKGSDKELRAYWRAQLVSQLTPDGVVALDDGRLCGVMSEAARKRYRNPPAHTRFLPLRVATECKEHVDRSLRLLRTWLVTYRKFPRRPRRDLTVGGHDGKEGSTSLQDGSAEAHSLSLRAQTASLLCSHDDALDLEEADERPEQHLGTNRQVAGRAEKSPLAAQHRQRPSKRCRVGGRVIAGRNPVVHRIEDVGRREEQDHGVMVLLLARNRRSLQSARQGAGVLQTHPSCSIASRACQIFCMCRILSTSKNITYT